MASPAAARPRVVAGLRLLRQVGEGGEGEVWEARNSAGRRRALKLIRPDALVPPAEVERRGRWLLAIDHPALVTVHRCGVLSGAGLDGWGFVEMAFVDGPDLEDAAADPDALARLAPLAEALDLLHAGTWSDGMPLIHRDVKPANLIEDTDGELVLVDASTLRDIDDGTRTRIGTPLFAAPEVVTGRAGPLADVYSFAATAVALLTGARRGELAALLDTPEALDVPPGLRAALAPDPQDRPVSCRAALDPDLPLVVGAEVGWFPAELAEAEGAPGFAPVPPAPSGSPTAPGTRQPAPPTGGGWMPSASAVLLDPWTDPFGPPPPAPPWGWLVALAVLAGAPLLAALGPLTLAERIGVVSGSGALAVVGALAARRPFPQALLLPPVAWAFLLADRAAAPGVRRAWARVTCLGGTSVLVGLAASAPLLPDEVDPVVAAALGLLAWVAAALGAVAARGSRLLRLGLAPVWVLGALLLLAGGLVLLPFAVLLWRGGPVLAVLTGTAGSLAAFVRQR